MKTHKKLFFLIVFLIPVNLGKHYIFNWAYVNGILTDYLIPTVYVTDILIGGLLVLYLGTFGCYLFGQRLRSSNSFAYLTLFLFAVFLSVLSAHEFYPAFYAFVKLLLYIGFFVYVVCTFDFAKNFKFLIKILIVQVLLLGILGSFQWFKQGAVFNNYLFFGEQPYSISTKGIVKENFFGVTKVPPYGLFRHPNVFGGYLCVILIWILWGILNLGMSKYWRGLGWGSFVLGIIVLFLTFSKTSWLVAGIGVWGILFPCRSRKRMLFFVASFFVISLGLPFLKVLNTSVVRRANFLEVSLKMFEEAPFFGVGLNNNVLLIDKYLVQLGKSGFNQPVHNVLFLILSESGIFAAVLFVLFLITSWVKTQNRLLFISVSQLLVLSFFDHYLYTINQAQILFWLTAGIALSTILVHEQS